MQPDEKINIEKVDTIHKEKIEKLLRQLLIEIGENPDREGLIGTPARMAEMYEEIFGGYKINSELDVSFTEAAETIIAKDIQFYSNVRTSYASIFRKDTHSICSCW